MVPTVGREAVGDPLSGAEGEVGPGAVVEADPVTGQLGGGWRFAPTERQAVGRRQGAQVADLREGEGGKVMVVEGANLVGVEGLIPEANLVDSALGRHEQRGVVVRGADAEGQDAVLISRATGGEGFAGGGVAVDVELDGAARFADDADQLVPGARVVAHRAEGIVAGRADVVAHVEGPAGGVLQAHVIAFLADDVLSVVVGGVDGDLVDAVPGGEGVFALLEVLERAVVGQVDAAEVVGEAGGLIELTRLAGADRLDDGGLVTVDGVEGDGVVGGHLEVVQGPIGDRRGQAGGVFGGVRKGGGGGAIAGALVAVAVEGGDAQLVEAEGRQTVEGPGAGFGLEFRLLDAVEVDAIVDQVAGAVQGRRPGHD